jgi:anti-sigma factor RsiW
MRKCADIEDRFTAYLDGYLETAEREIVEEHLSRCPIAFIRSKI